MTWIELGFFFQQCPNLEIDTNLDGERDCICKNQRNPYLKNEKKLKDFLLLLLTAFMEHRNTHLENRFYSFIMKHFDYWNFEIWILIFDFLVYKTGIDQQQIPPCCMMGINIPPTLTELAARSVAYHISFEIVERVCSPLPEQLQLRIAYWSFPDNEEDIRLYSCLANGSADEFQKGETMYRFGSVHCVLQIG